MSATAKAVSDPARQFLRHSLATIAYRGGKPLRNAPESFSTFRLSETSRTPGQIAAHMADLLEWTQRLALGQQWHDAWRPIAPSEWNHDVGRFFKALEQLDNYFATDKPCAMSLEILFQGPISDVITHVGQLAMLRRAAGSPVKGEVMIIADIEIGRVGADQAAPKREFD